MERAFPPRKSLQAEKRATMGREKLKPHVRSGKKPVDSVATLQVHSSALLSSSIPREPSSPPRENSVFWAMFSLLICKDNKTVKQPSGWFSSWLWSGRTTLTKPCNFFYFILFRSIIMISFLWLIALKCSYYHSNADPPPLFYFLYWGFFFSGSFIICKELFCCYLLEGELIQIFWWCRCLVRNWRCLREYSDKYVFTVS